MKARNFEDWFTGFWMGALIGALLTTVVVLEVAS